MIFFLLLFVAAFIVEVITHSVSLLYVNWGGSVLMHLVQGIFKNYLQVEQSQVCLFVFSFSLPPPLFSRFLTLIWIRIFVFFVSHLDSWLETSVKEADSCHLRIYFITSALPCTLSFDKCTFPNLDYLFQLVVYFNVRISELPEWRQDPEVWENDTGSALMRRGII